MLLPPSARIKVSKEELAMRIRTIAWRQGTLLLEGREFHWKSLPEKTRKEVLALLSRLLLDHARAKTGVEGRK